MKGGGSIPAGRKTLIFLPMRCIFANLGRTFHKYDEQTFYFCVVRRFGIQRFRRFHGPEHSRGQGSRRQGRQGGEGEIPLGQEPEERGGLRRARNWAARVIFPARLLSSTLNFSRSTRPRLRRPSNVFVPDGNVFSGSGGRTTVAPAVFWEERWEIFPTLFLMAQVQKKLHEIMTNAY